MLSTDIDSRRSPQKPAETLRLLDLFSGIGGFSLGLERSGGFQTVAFCEIEPYCRAVLKKHWPDVPCYDDVRTLTAARLAADGIIAPVDDAECSHGASWGNGSASKFQAGGERQTAFVGGSGQYCHVWSGIDAICGGFPCQDISVAGKGAGIEGERSGLWSEYARIIGEVRPRIVIVENVAAMLGRGLSRVLGDLATLGFDAEWHCIPASAVGAPHRRDRLWIVAYADAGGHERSRGILSENINASRGPDSRNGGEDVADTARKHVNGTGIAGPRWGQEPPNRDWWFIEPNVGRVAHGVPTRVDRLRSLGNAVVPQIPEIIGRAIAMTAKRTAAGGRGT
jgi:DNA (cytosine-5)-methyltransferase 1